MDLTLEQVAAEIRLRLIALASRRGAVADETEDVVQEALCRAIRHRSTIDTAKLEAWLCAVVANLSRDSYRKRVRNQKLVLRRDLHPSPGEDHQEWIPEYEAVRQLGALVRRLPPLQQRVVAAVFKGESLASFAQRNRISVRSCEGHLRRARKTLRRWCAGA